MPTTFDTGRTVPSTSYTAGSGRVSGAYLLDVDGNYILDVDSNYIIVIIEGSDGEPIESWSVRTVI